MRIYVYILYNPKELTTCWKVPAHKSQRQTSQTQKVEVEENVDYISHMSRLHAKKVRAQKVKSQTIKSAKVKIEIDVITQKDESTNALQWEKGFLDMLDRTRFHGHEVLTTINMTTFRQLRIWNFKLTAFHLMHLMIRKSCVTIIGGNEKLLKKTSTFNLKSPSQSQVLSFSSWRSSFLGWCVLLKKNSFHHKCTLLTYRVL